MIDSPFPPTFDYRSVGPYTSIVVRTDGTAVVKRKRRLLKACMAMYRHVDHDEALLSQLIDANGYVLFSCRKGGVMLGCADGFAAVSGVATFLGYDWMHGDLFALELESRIMWPADA